MIGQPRRAAADLIGIIASRSSNSTKLRQRATYRECADWPTGSWPARATPIRQSAAARALARRQEDAVLRFVEALRDARWQMMALRARFDADSRDGPTFDNPAEMRRYLAAS